MKKLLLLFILLINIFACKKRYEEGPRISFRSVVDRITGVWKLEYAEMNGNDVSIFIGSLGIDSFSFEKIRDSYCGQNQDRCKRLLIFIKKDNCSADYFWELDEGKKNITIWKRMDYCPDSNLVDTGTVPLPYIIYGEPYNKKFVVLSGIWKIQKLTMGKMWLEKNYYKIHFKKIREIDNGI